MALSEWQYVQLVEHVGYIDLIFFPDFPYEKSIQEHGTCCQNEAEYNHAQLHIKTGTSKTHDYPHKHHGQSERVTPKHRTLKF